MILIKNKVLIKLIVPEADQTFDVMLPINRKIGNIVNLLNKYVSDNTNGEIVLSKTNILYNAVTNERYSANSLLAETNIRNGSILVLLSSK